jgi:hypothetical protein
VLPSSLVRLRLIEGGQGPAATRSSDVESSALGDDATLITPIPLPDQPEPDPDFDEDMDGLDVATVLVRSSHTPIDPSAVESPPPYTPEPPQRSSESLPPYRPSAESIAPMAPSYRPSAESIPPMAPPYADSIPPMQYRSSSESIPPMGYPNPSQPYLPYPYPPPVPVAPPSRGRALLALALGGVLVAGGLTLGWVLFGNDDEPAVATAPPAPSPPPPTTSVPSPPPPKVDPPPPKPAVEPPARAEPAAITSLVHPTLVAVTSPIGGQVSEITKQRDVKPGEVLLAVRGKSVRNAQTIALTRKVAELEALAKQDPGSYQPFLARTRRELAVAQRPELVSIKASSAGVFEPRVEVGDKVADGAPVGAMIDPQTWHASAIVRGVTPLASWSCVVATGDASHSAACKILTTEAVADGTRVTVEIQASGTEWLKDAGQQPRIIVEPGSAR